MNNEYVAKYYDETLLYYKHLWSREANALHYGFWNKETKNVKEALINENVFLAEIADIKSSDLVLDAGCGIGGSSIWLGKNIGANVIGITLSKKQLVEAKKLAAKYGINDKVEFKVGDYLQTDFPDNTFDIVWAIESVCHTQNKADFIAEAYRILKPGGRMVVADGFLNRDVLKNEEKLFDNFLIGFTLSNLAEISDFKKDMEIIGFKEIKFWDKTINIKKSLKMLYIRVLIGYPFLRFANLLGLVPDSVIKTGLAGIAQYKFFNNGLMLYGVFLGKK